MLATSKHRIRHRFQSALDTYGENAPVQAGMAERVFQYIADYQGSTISRLLEIGCGTGFLTHQLLEHCTLGQFFINDLVSRPPLHPAMADNARIRYLAGDAETLDFPAQLDLITSNATFQWFKNLPAFFNKISPLLHPGGLLIFSTFGKQQFHELSPWQDHTLPYCTTDELKAMLDGRFDILTTHEEIIVQPFPNAKAVMQHMHATGVSGLSARVWTKSAFQNMLNEYDKKYATGRGVTLTYHPMYVVARRRS